ncbi:cytochrome P450 [Geopyxis carbonaria]|nr:cytochrome P450 [Geopyxis carbonaria]
MQVELSPSNAIYAFIVSYTIYWTGVIIYRLYFHPLSRFPGPRIAAATMWYEIWFDVIKDGKLGFQLPRLHAKYGPVVRISPHELHIKDVTFYEQVYKQNTRFTKDPRFYESNNVPLSSITMTNVHENRQRRMLLNPYFSKRTIESLSPRLNKTISKFSTRLDEFAVAGNPLNLQKAFHCFTVDFITEYAFGKCANMLEDPEFESAYVRAIQASAKTQWTAKHFPWTRKLAMAVPFLFRHLDRGLADLRDLCESVVKELIEAKKSGKNSTLDAQHSPTVFDSLLDPPDGSLAPEYKSLVAESMILVVAGTETTAMALCFATYYILTHPSVKKRLLEELATVPVEKDGNMALNVIDKLPYLSAVIKETLRLANIVPTKLSRVTPREGAYLESANIMIPPGAIVSMNHYVLHQNEKIFVAPRNFIPERWLGEDGKALDKYLVSFSKGSRACLGINLAYAELYVVLAKLFSKYNMEVWKTTEDDMAWSDNGVVHTKGELNVKLELRK